MSSACTISRDTRSCTSNTSSIVPLNFSDQSGASDAASTSCAVIRRLLPALRTLPSRTYCTPSSRPIVFASFFAPLSCIADVREMTLSARTFARSEMISSVSPSPR